MIIELIAVEKHQHNFKRCLIELKQRNIQPRELCQFYGQCNRMNSLHFLHDQGFSICGQEFTDPMASWGCIDEEDPIWDCLYRLEGFYCSPYFDETTFEKMEYIEANGLVFEKYGR